MLRFVIAILVVSSAVGCTFADDQTCASSADGTPCDDRDPCTHRDRCTNGACTAGDAVSCETNDPCLLPGTCNPATGACVHDPRDDGTACDDNNACTSSDRCATGVCVGSAIVCDRPDDCRLDGVCDPRVGACVYPIAADGAACGDGDPCTESDVCRDGVCLGGPAKDCGDADACGGAGVCDPATGMCRRDTEPDGTPCDDDDVCSVGDRCVEGACIATSPLLCSTDDACRRNTGCDATTGCLYADAIDGTACTDGDACSTGDFCSAGTCTSTIGVVCVALDQCHDAGICDAATGCTNPPKSDGAFCDDGQRCTALATCLAGTCTASVAVTCPGSPSECLADGRCNPTNGDCFFPPLADGTGCTDHNSCTTADGCLAGRCEGTRVPSGAVPCSDGICFTTVTATAGITFTSTASMMMGAGAAFFDFDNDGALDIALGSEGLGVRIYRNAGATFVDVTAQVGVTPLATNDRFMGFAVADYDGDHDDDLYLAVMGANRLYRNDAGVFVDVTNAMGVGDPRWTTAAAFGDYDGDGDLDLYVGNYVQTINFPNHTPYPNALYRNDGATFTDVSATLGVAGAGTTLAVTWTDFDDDGDVDLFVCNDFGAFIEPNQLYRNDGGTFVEVGRAMNFDVGIYCMGIAASDYDGDLDLDYYFTNLGRNVFLENRGNTFVDVTTPTGTTLTTDQCRAPLLTTSWGVGFYDFDADGREELYVSNGHIPAGGSIVNAEDSPNTLFVRGAPFVDASESARVADRQIGRGVAFGDYDGDGDVDILQANVIGDAILLRNDSPNLGTFLRVELEGRTSNPSGFGARLIATTGTVAHVREANANFGFESSSEKTVHFGLGAATFVDLSTRWPSGVRQQLFDVPSGMTLSLVEPHVTTRIVSASPDPVATGQSITVVADLVNHSASTVTVAYSIDLTSAGVITPGNGGTRVVGPMATVSVSGAVVVPATATGTSAVTVTVSENGAATQARRAVGVSP